MLGWRCSGSIVPPSIVVSREISAETFGRDGIRPVRFFKDLLDREKVTERLGHLLLIDVNEAVMDPVMGKGLEPTCADHPQLLIDPVT